jgi:hypothetical protein
MKPIKVFGFGVVVALMAMAFAGASSAMAESTALCDTDPGTGSTAVCPSGHLITHVHLVTLAGVKAKLLSNLTIECEILFLGDTLSSLANPLVIHGNFTFTNCSGGCIVTETSADSLLSVLKLGHETADLTLDGAWFFDCGTIFECEYEAAGFKGIGKGPLLSSETDGDFAISGQEFHKLGGGFFCPKTAKLDMSLTPSPSPIYITN